MPKLITFDTAAREKLQAGVNQLANAVKVTLGAKGRNVIIDIEHGSPQITKDGVTVARSIDLEDRIENMGAQLIKDVAQKTNELAGDGTTTATILAQAIFTTGLKSITAGSNPMDLKRGIDKAVHTVVNQLKELAVPVGENIKDVATISANSDEEIGLNIAEAIKAVSVDGVITIEQNNGIETVVDIVDGMQYPKGYMSPYFVTDTVKLDVEYLNPRILIHQGNITNPQTLLATLQIIVDEQRPLVIISDDISLEVINWLVMNKIRGAVQVVAVKAPSYGQMRKDMMEDIAVLTNALVMHPEIGLQLPDITADQLGQADKVLITANSTTIIGGRGVKEEIKQRVATIRYQIDNATSPYDKEQLQERLAKMVGGVGVIRVGGTSEVDIKERKDRFEDALNATKAAIEEGIVPGGGLALMNCDLSGIKGRNEDEEIGINIIRKAISEPFNQILKNAGISPDTVRSKLTSPTMGYDVYDDKYCDFIETGIIDPVKVTRVALENAASISGLLLTTECVVSVITEKTKSND